jgi:hypothetical protein
MGLLLFIRIPTRFKTPALRPKSTGLKAGDKLVKIIINVKNIPSVQQAGACRANEAMLAR